MLRQNSFHSFAICVRQIYKKIHFWLGVGGVVWGINYRSAHKTRASAREHTHTQEPKAMVTKRGERVCGYKKKQYFMFLEGMLRRVRVLGETDLRSHIRPTPQTKNIIICIYVELVLNMLLSILVFLFCMVGDDVGGG